VKKCGLGQETWRNFSKRRGGTSAKYGVELFLVQKIMRCLFNRIRKEFYLNPVINNMLKIKLLLILLIFSTLEFTDRDSVDFAVYKTIAFNNKGDTFLARRSLGYGFIIRISQKDKVSTQIYDLEESDGIQKIIFAGDKKGWLINGGTLYHSQDDGQTWVKQSFPIIRRIHSMEFNNNQG